MTMQIALAGKDGVVLASDTSWMESPTVDPQTGLAFRFTEGKSKLKLDCQRGIVISCARNMETSDDIGRMVLDLRDADWGDPINPILRGAEPILDAAGPGRCDAQCLIVSANPLPRLFKFHSGLVRGQVRSYCALISGGKAFAGDNANPALFLTERYYQEGQTAEQLIALAAHVVLFASKHNPGISGLEIAVCKPNSIERLSPESLLELKLAATELDNSLAEMLTAHKQFTYTPDVIG